jgi:vacuolar-type H+-ATPase subunit I/STV1
MGSVRLIGKFATIVGYAAMILGIYAAIKSLASKAIEEGIKQEALNLSKEQMKAEVTKRLAEMSISDVLTTALKQAIVSVKDAIVNVFTQSSMDSVTQSVNTIVDSLSNLLKAYDFYASEQTKKVEAELKELQEEEQKYNEEIQNRALMSMAGTTMLVHERLSTPDALQDLAASMQEKVGQDENYLAWYTDVNS